jgi:hypothetical protein
VWVLFEPLHLQHQDLSGPRLCSAGLLPDRLLLCQVPGQEMLPALRQGRLLW